MGNLEKSERIIPAVVLGLGLSGAAYAEKQPTEVADDSHKIALDDRTPREPETVIRENEQVQAQLSDADKAFTYEKSIEPIPDSLRPVLIEKYREHLNKQIKRTEDSIIKLSSDIKDLNTQYSEAPNSYIREEKYTEYIKKKSILEETIENLEYYKRKLEDLDKGKVDDEDLRKMRSY